jgi:hypothetical protein
LFQQVYTKLQKEHQWKQRKQEKLKAKVVGESERPETENLEVDVKVDVKVDLLPSRVLIVRFCSQRAYFAALEEHILAPAPYCSFLAPGKKLPIELQTFTTVCAERAKNEVTVVSCYLDDSTCKLVPIGAFNVPI